ACLRGRLPCPSVRPGNRRRARPGPRRDLRGDLPPRGRVHRLRPGRGAPPRVTRIASVRTTAVSVPFATDEVWAYGRRRGITNLLVEVETDDGVVGLGESVGWPTPEVAERVLEAATPLALGHDVFRIEELMRRLYLERGWHYFRHTAGCALAGLEMALWDAV